MAFSEAKQTAVQHYSTATNKVLDFKVGLGAMPLSATPWGFSLIKKCRKFHYYINLCDATNVGSIASGAH